MGQSTEPEDFGALIRGARCSARLTQAQSGAKCGYSASAISRIEANKLRPEYSAMLRMCEVLAIPPQRMHGFAAPDASAVATVAIRCPSDEEDAVRRRKLLTGALAAGATAIVGGGTASAAAVSGDPTASLEEALFRLPAAEPMALPLLTLQTAAARRAFRAARYRDLGQALPGLLASAEVTREAATGRARQQASGVLARAYVLTAELASKQHSDAAWVAADRALSAARDSGTPVPVGEASRVPAITMRRSGRWSSAVHLLTREAAELDAASGFFSHRGARRAAPRGAGRPG
ncbi:multiprotein-bridging factor 1 family protein [Streptomyces sp. NPDC087849]|uniref:helix-turn-helix domain-containing protein n=1 Tax=Streptomyces sp. NPDC087849 TaxID=3365808 RepID=UPI003826874A